MNLSKINEYLAQFGGVSVTSDDIISEAVPPALAALDQEYVAALTCLFDQKDTEHAFRNDDHLATSVVFAKTRADGRELTPENLHKSLDDLCAMYVAQTNERVSEAKLKEDSDAIKRGIDFVLANCPAVAQGV